MQDWQPADRNFPVNSLFRPATPRRLVASNPRQWQVYSEIKLGQERDIPLIFFLLSAGEGFAHALRRDTDSLIVTLCAYPPPTSRASFLDSATLPADGAKL